MVEVYVILILEDKRTFDQVPVKLQPLVEQRLRDLGFDRNGDPLPEARRK